MVTAMWVYGFGYPSWTTAVEIGRLQCLGIDRVFLALEPAQLSSIVGPSSVTTAVAEFITRARAVGIAVHAMVDQNETWWKTANHPLAKQQVSDVLTYNANNPLAAFAGVHLDCEPWAVTMNNPTWANDAELETRLQQLNTLFADNRALVNTYNTAHPSATIPLSAAITWWLERNAALPSGHVATLKTNLHEVVLMAFNITVLSDLTVDEQHVVQTAPTIIGLQAINFASWSALQTMFAQLAGHAWMMSTGSFDGVGVFGYDTRTNGDQLPISDVCITPWGAVTGIPPTWQSPDIYTVDCVTDVRQSNAVNGQVNCLVARLTNWGRLPATGVSVNFKYAPWFTGIPDAAFVDLGTVAAPNFAPGQTQEVRVNWDLTDGTFTNHGAWSHGQREFAHYCVRVAITAPSDLCPTNNAAQSNFVDMVGGFEKVSHVIVGNPFDFLVEARLLLAPLPAGFDVVLEPDFVKGFGERFALQAAEQRTATLTFQRAAQLRDQPLEDVIADISLEVNGKVVGGISTRLYAAAKRTLQDGDGDPWSWRGVVRRILRWLRQIARR